MSGYIIYFYRYEMDDTISSSEELLYFMSKLTNKQFYVTRTVNGEDLYDMYHGKLKFVDGECMTKDNQIISPERCIYSDEPNIEGQSPTLAVEIIHTTYEHTLVGDYWYCECSEGVYKFTTKVLQMLDDTRMNQLKFKLLQYGEKITDTYSKDEGLVIGRVRELGG